MGSKTQLYFGHPADTECRQNSGFVIIIALITSTIILAIAIGVLSISLKDYTFSGFTTSSTQALFAADTGLDCALAYDIKTPTFSVPTTPVFLNPTIVLPTLRTSYFPSGMNYIESGAVGDLNNDGLGDIVVASRQTPGAISVHINAGDGVFPLANRTIYPTGGSYQESVAIGDLNGDGYKDIATTPFGTGEPLSLFRNSGSGTFGPVATPDRTNYILPYASPDSRVALGDLNGDGKLDIAVTDGAYNKIYLYRNIGTGGAGSALSFSYEGFLLGGDPQSIALGDLNGDGKLDIVTGNAGSTDTIEIYRNIGIGGAGSPISFDPKVSYATGNNPSAVDIGDLNGDGKFNDIAVVNNSTPYGISFFRYTGANSSVAFNSINTFTRDPNSLVVGIPSGVVITDLNTDGRGDIAISNTDVSFSDVLVYKNTSTGGPGSTIYFDGTGIAVDQDPSNSGHIPYFVAAGDLNNDDMPDLVSAVRFGVLIDNVTVFLNIGAPGGIDDCVPGPTPSKVDCAGQVNIPASTTCNCQFPTPSPASASPPRTCKTTFNLTTNICVETEIFSTYDHKNTYTPSDDTETQRIRSWGHNTCDTTNPKRVERALELNYGQ